VWHVRGGKGDRSAKEGSKKGFKGGPKLVWWKRVTTSKPNTTKEGRKKTQDVGFHFVVQRGGGIWG